METGVRGGVPERAAAARWIAAAGDDDQVLDLAAELLLADAGAEMPTPLLNRLQQRSPDDLPAAIVRVVAEQLDGSLPLAPYWRARCLQLFVAGEPTCSPMSTNWSPRAARTTCPRPFATRSGTAAHRRNAGPGC